MTEETRTPEPLTIAVDTTDAPAVETRELTEVELAQVVGGGGGRRPR